MLNDYSNIHCTSKNIDKLIKKHVKIKTYLTLRPIYGKILESTESTITVAPRYLGSEDIDYDKMTTYLLPKNSIIEIHEI